MRYFFIQTAHQFLGAFAELRKATVSFVISVHSQLDSDCTDFDETWYIRCLKKSVEKIQI